MLQKKQQQLQCDQTSQLQDISQTKNQPIKCRMQSVNTYLSSHRNPPEGDSDQCDIRVSVEDAFQMFQQRKYLDSLLISKNKKEEENERFTLKDESSAQPSHSLVIRQSPQVQQFNTPRSQLYLSDQGVFKQPPSSPTEYQYIYKNNSNKFPGENTLKLNNTLNSHSNLVINTEDTASQLCGTSPTAINQLNSTQPFQNFFLPPQETIQMKDNSSQNLKMLKPTVASVSPVPTPLSLNLGYSTPRSQFQDQNKSKVEMKQMQTAQFQSEKLYKLLSTLTQQTPCFSPNLAQEKQQLAQEQPLQQLESQKKQLSNTSRFSFSKQESHYLQQKKNSVLNEITLYNNNNQSSNLQTHRSQPSFTQKRQEQQLLQNPDCQDDPSMRSFTKFLEKQEAFQKQKIINAQREKQKADKKIEATIKSKPHISKTSRQIIERNSVSPSSLSPSGNVHERLYMQKSRTLAVILQKNKLEAEAVSEKENTFHPLIQKRSKSIKRTQNVDDILYQDAKRRIEIQQQSNQKPPPNSSFSAISSSPLSLSPLSDKYSQKFTSQKSEKILLSKFLREMTLIVCSLESTEQEMTDCFTLNMACLFEVMIKIGFVKCQINAANIESAITDSESKLLFLVWTLLCGKDQSRLQLENIIYFCLIILNLDEALILLKEQQGIQHSPNNKINCNPEKDPITLYPLQCFRIAKQIQQKKREPLQISPSSAQSLNQQKNNQLNDFLMKTYLNSYVTVNVGFFNENNLWCVTQEEKKIIRNAFEIFVYNRLTYEELKHQRQPNDNHCTFSPHILDNAKYLAKMHKEKILIEAASAVVGIAENNNSNRDIQDIHTCLPKSIESDKLGQYDLQILQKKTQKAALEIKRKAQQEAETAECTFSPQIIYLNSNTSSKGTTAQVISSAIKKTDELHKQSKYKRTNYFSNQNNPNNTQFINNQDYERQKEECTFKPQINAQFSNKPYQGGFFARNIDKTIERMRNARKYKELVHQLKMSGNNNVHKKTIASLLNTSSSQNGITFIQSENNSHGTRNENINKTTPRSATQRNNSSNSNIQQMLDNEQQKQSKFQLQNQVVLEQQSQNTQQQQSPEFRCVSQNYVGLINQPIQINEIVTQMQEILPLNQMLDGQHKCSDDPMFAQEWDEKEDCAEFKSEKIPLLFVDVSLGNQRNQRIVVNEGDSPSQLAEDFAREHGLDENTAIKLGGLLENQIAGLLSRIEEEDNSSNLDYMD